MNRFMQSFTNSFTNPFNFNQGLPHSGMDPSIMVNEHGKQFRQDPVTNLYSEVAADERLPSSPVQRHNNMNDVFMGAPSAIDMMGTAGALDGHYPSPVSFQPTKRAQVPEADEFHDTMEISDDTILQAQNAASIEAGENKDERWTVSSVADLNEENRIMEIEDDDNENITKNSDERLQATTVTFDEEEYLADNESGQQVPDQNLPAAEPSPTSQLLDEIMGGILQRERTSPSKHAQHEQPASPQARNEKAAGPIIPPLSETGNAFQHHADGGEAWMDRAAEEGMVDPQLTGYGLGDTVSCYSRCSTPEEHDDEHQTPIRAPTPAVLTPINKDKRQAAVDVEDTKEDAQPPSAKKRKTEKQMSSPKVQEAVEKVQLNDAQRSHRALHERAKLLKPNHTVSDTRYWIGVLRDGVPLGKVKDSGDIMWLKGHKSTCVKTIYHTYKQHAIPPGDFRLQLRDEFPDKNDVMEELDLYADRMVIFRCCVFHHIIDDSDEDE